MQGLDIAAIAFSLLEKYKMLKSSLWKCLYVCRVFSGIWPFSLQMKSVKPRMYVTSNVF